MRRRRRARLDNPEPCSACWASETITTGTEASMWTKRARKACSVLCLGSSLTAACHQHVALEAPTAAAPEAERVVAYSKLRPLSYHETKTTLTSDWAGVMTQRNVDYLQLAGGQRIYFPEDLLDVVPSDSPAGRAASDSHSSRKLG